MYGSQFAAQLGICMGPNLVSSVAPPYPLVGQEPPPPTRGLEPRLDPHHARYPYLPHGARDIGHTRLSLNQMIV